MQIHSLSSFPVWRSLPVRAAAPSAEGEPLRLVPPRLAPDPVVQGYERILSLQRPDGTWRTTYLGSPMHTLVPVIALNHVGCTDPDCLLEDARLLEGVARLQNPDGSLPFCRNGDASRIVTSLFVLAVEVARKNGNPHLAALEAPLAKAREYVDRSRWVRDPAVTVGPVHDLLWDLSFPETSRRTLPLAVSPASLRVTDGFLHHPWLQGVRDQVSLGVLSILPAMAVMNYRALEDRTLVRWQNRALELVGLGMTPERRQEVLDSLERAMTERQDQNGGWFLAMASTSFNMVALKELGYGPDDPRMQRAIGFLRGSRVSTPQGLVQLAWRGELWDTAVMTTLLLRRGLPATDARVAAGLRQILAAQVSDGGFPFAIGSDHVPDYDSTSLGLLALVRAWPTAGPELRAALKPALERAADFLLTHQNSDGGWPGYGGTRHSFGNRAPGMLEGLLFDASSADVTGRVTLALVACRDAGLLPADRVGPALDRALDYFRAARSPCGGWWSRWITGYLPGTYFALAALRALGEDPGQEMIQRARRFLQEHQNPDGGWGESVEADRKLGLAGTGPSTPLQTAFAIGGLALSDPGPSAADPQIRTGVSYLTAWAQGGQWPNPTPLLTILPAYEYYDGPEMNDAFITAMLSAYEGEVGGAGKQAWNLG
ncbi:MAG: prenyltransferase/squalene oxidase repeat-containing protein [Candidatus Eremiobacterota bacterium]